MYVHKETLQPVTLREIKRAFPNVSHPRSGPSEEWLAASGYAILHPVESPEIPANKIAFQDGVEEINGQWRQKWRVRDLTQVEQDAKFNLKVQQSDKKMPGWAVDL